LMPRGPKGEKRPADVIGPPSWSAGSPQARLRIGRLPRNRRVRTPQPSRTGRAATTRRRAAGRSQTYRSSRCDRHLTRPCRRRLKQQHEFFDHHGDDLGRQMRESNNGVEPIAEFGREHPRDRQRRYVLKFFEKLPPCLVGVEACASSHHWSRELQTLGHTVRLMPPAYVKPM
jgi:hypothetical protein